MENVVITKEIKSTIVSDRLREAILRLPDSSVDVGRDLINQIKKVESQIFASLNYMDELQTRLGEELGEEWSPREAKQAGLDEFPAVVSKWCGYEK